MGYIWTDDPIPITTKIKHSYITELRERTAIELNRREQFVRTWSDNELDDTITNLAIHIEELRLELNDLCNSHLPAERFADHVAYDTNYDLTNKRVDDRTYQTNVETSLYEVENSGYRTSKYSADFPTKVSGCSSQDTGVANGMCSGYDYGRHITVCNGANSSDLGGYQISDCGNNFTWHNSGDNGSIGSGCSSQDISLHSGL